MHQLAVVIAYEFYGGYLLRPSLLAVSFSPLFSMLKKVRFCEHFGDLVLLLSRTWFYLEGRKK